jgi:hypothetical protein
MVELIQNSGDTNHPKRKSESNFTDAGKKSRQFFCLSRFLKIVTDVTIKDCYIL